MAMSFDEDFVLATKRVNECTGLDSSTMLEFYGLYKQATAGDARGNRPSAFDLKGRAKYDAWATRAGLSRDDAKRLYIEAAGKLA
jgi:diazepam-binding inhibitor (GABA receptor modulator, acyl-CoA-binding protein)